MEKIIKIFIQKIQIVIMKTNIFIEKIIQKIIQNIIKELPKSLSVGF